MCWGQQSEIAAEFAKGDAAFLEGRLQTREWEDSEGNKRTTTEVIASMCQKLAVAPSKQRDEKPKASKPQRPDLPEEDIPF